MSLPYEAAIGRDRGPGRRIAFHSSARLLRPFLIIPSLIAAHACARSAAATTILPIDLGGLVQYSETVVVGTVSAVRSDWTPDHRSIYTEVTLTNLSFLKGGRATATYTFRMIGGRVGDAWVKAVGAPEFSVGERELLFLRRDKSQLMPVIGWTQGRLRLRDGHVLTDAGLQVLGIREGRLVVEQRPSRSPLTAYTDPVLRRADPSPLHVGKPARRQYPDREEEIPDGVPTPIVLAPDPGRFGGTMPASADGYPIGRGPIYEPVRGRRTEAAMTEENFVAALVALLRDSR